MAQILKLAQVNTDGISNQDISANELVADSFTFGGAAGTNVTKTIVDLLIAQTHAPMSDNQNVIAGAGLTGGGSGAAVTLNVATADASITVAADAISVARDPAGAVGLGTGLLILVDNVGIEITGNALQLKAFGVLTSNLANNAVTDSKLSSSVSVDADRAVSTLHIKDAAVTETQLAASVAGPGLTGGAGTALAVNTDNATLEISTDVLRIKDGGVTDAKVASGIDAAKISGGTISNTEFDFLNGVTSNIQGQLNITVPNTRQVNTTAPLTGGGALSADLTIAIPAATTSVNGYLTSTDWNTFNNKQPAGNYITALTGMVTAAGPGSVAATIANNVVTEFMLTTSVAGNGLSGGNGTALAVNVDAVTISIVADALQANQVPLVKQPMIAGESFAANTSFLVRWALTGETAGRVYKADCTSAASQGKFYAFGIALSTSLVAASGTIDVIELGMHTLGSSDTPFAGADVGKPVYLTTAGAFSVTPPTTSAAAVFRAGVVRTTSTMHIGLQQLNGINP